MAKDKANIWMPVYIGDYLADTMRLTTEQHGAYLLLLFEHWMRGPIPDDDETLAAISRMPIDRWIKTRGLLLGYFWLSDGFWHQKRVQAEKEKAEAFKMKQSANGSKGGRPKRDNENPNNPNVSQTEANSKAKQNPNESPLPLPLQYLKDIPPTPKGGGEGDGEKPKREDTIPYEAIAQLFRDAFPSHAQPCHASGWHKTRKGAVKARWDEDETRQSLDWWGRYFKYAASREFLTGKTSAGFEATFDWLVKPTNMQKVCEGNYR